MTTDSEAHAHVEEPNVPDRFLDDLFRLEGLVAVVTGGAGGLGEAMAHGLAQAGAIVAIADLSESRAKEIVDSVGDRSYSLYAYEVDVTKKADVAELVRAVAADHGSIDILVNSAGITRRHAAEDFPEEDWDNIIAVNLKGSFLSCQAVGRRMIAQGRGGSIINMASIGASIVYPHSTAYTQSKGGVLQLTRSLALEWSVHGIRVNALAPTTVNTSLLRNANATRSLTADFISARQLVDREFEPFEFVGPCVFLASKAASMVTGHMLQVDAGYTIA